MDETLHPDMDDQVRAARALKFARIEDDELNALDVYQQQAAEYDLPAPTKGQLWYYGLGLTGEAGEVADKLKKTYRVGGVVNERDIALELGDVLWYLATIARMLNMTLSEVARMNVEKLESRMQRGTVFGSGDNR